LRGGRNYSLGLGRPEPRQSRRGLRDENGCARRVQRTGSDRAHPRLARRSSRRPGSCAEKTEGPTTSAGTGRGHHRDDGSPPAEGRTRSSTAGAGIATRRGSGAQAAGSSTQEPGPDAPRRTLEGSPPRRLLLSGRRWGVLRRQGPRGSSRGSQRPATILPAGSARLGGRNGPAEEPGYGSSTPHVIVRHAHAVPPTDDPAVSSSGSAAGAARGPVT